MLECRWLIGAMLVIVGVSAVAFPAGVVDTSIAASYNTGDLVRGWGLYAVALGLAVAAVDSFRVFVVLAACFAASIAWHLQIVYRTGPLPRGWTRHHANSLLANGAALLFAIGCCLWLNARSSR